MKRETIFIMILTITMNCGSALGLSSRASSRDMYLLSLTGLLLKPSLDQRLRGIWIAGGLDNNTVNNHTDLYDPETSRYFSDAAGGLNVPRSFLTLASTGKMVYAIGGVNGSGVASNTVEVLDVTQDFPVWSVTSSLNVARINPVADAVGSKLYVLSGSQSTTPTLYAGSTEELTTSGWSASYLGLLVADQRLDGAGGELNGAIHLAGGRNATVGRITVNNAWIQSGSNAATALMTGIVEPAMSAVVGNANEQRWGCDGAGVTNNSLPPTFFIVGGHIANPTTNTYPVPYGIFTAATKLVSNYRAGTTVFQTSLNMLYARAFPRAISITTGSFPGLYVVGGATSAGTVPQIEYLPISGSTTGSFTERASMIYPRYGHGATKVNP